MAWQEFAPFSSSNIASARYENEQHILEITFHNGGAYQYYDVPTYVATAFDQAGSKGSFLATNIKGHYRYTKV